MVDSKLQHKIIARLWFWMVLGGSEVFFEEWIWLVLYDQRFDEFWSWFKSWHSTNKASIFLTESSSTLEYLLVLLALDFCREIPSTTWFDLSLIEILSESNTEILSYNCYSLVVRNYWVLRYFIGCWSVRTGIFAYKDSIAKFEEYTQFQVLLGRVQRI